ncbi:Putative NADPH-quinone reductase (modulator of drug activity B) [Cohaesibacter sp. ES.047]|uniref:NAD(P)H-dependent oxidoreductase n=1 Tax=Cohaesibacter sp. ES.047 TaxID=1798205 RepID=UPI000BB71303|nr:NAD(P)H-dependent oxidoreductase [Cohaesibacter sp. ES.047]SNY93628.1 Putative NADPH-quinone reductase (modulator of drug activity B) [Cohaesibacter sp. ES.047]
MAIGNKENKGNHILILNGHPAGSSLSKGIADRYEQKAQNAGYHVARFNLADMQFNSDFGQATYKNAPKLEADLQAFWDALEKCDHFVLTHPLWWGGMPAKLKGLFDRILLPGRAFAQQKGAPLPKKLLTNKTAHVFITSDTPNWYFKLFLGAAIAKQIKKQILGYVGFSPVQVTNFATTKASTAQVREKWLTKVGKFAQTAR